MTGAGPAPAAEPPRRRAWKPFLMLAAAVFLLHAAVTGGHLMSPDGELLYRQAEAMALQGRIDVRPLEWDDEARRLLVPPEAAFAVVQAPGGRFHPQYLPLQPLLSVPVLWAAEATRPLLGEAFARTLPGTARHPVMEPHRAWRRGFLVMVFNPAVAALTALVLARVVLVMTRDRRGALWVAGLWAFGTMAWPHSRTYFTEPLAGLLAMVAVERLLRWRATPAGTEGSRRRLVLALQFGAALAAGMATRMDSPLIALGLGAGMVLVGEHQRLLASARGEAAPANAWRDYAAAGAVVLAGYIALLLYNDYRFTGLAQLKGLDLWGMLTGGYSDQEEGVRFTTPLLVGLHGYLLSPGKGMFFFSPALLLGVWGWCKAPRSLRWVGWLLVVGFLPFTLAMVKWQNWDGGWCWGPRHIHQLHAPIMLGAAFLFTGIEGWRPLRNGIIKGVAVVAVAVQLLGSSQSPMDFYDELYQTTADGHYFTAGYRPFEYPTVGRAFAVSLREGDGSAGPEVAPALLPAPLVDSLYLPHHTQWPGNAWLWRLGYRDWLLWRVATGQGHRESIEALREGAAAAP